MLAWIHGKQVLSSKPVVFFDRITIFNKANLDFSKAFDLEPYGVLIKAIE